MKVKMDVKGIKEIENEIRKFAKKPDEVKKVVYTTALEIQRQAKDNVTALGAIDTGFLRKSISIEMKKDDFEAEIGPEAPYGVYVEFGTRPHFPPPDALESWARHHGFESSWPICQVIAKRGLKERPFLYPAFFALLDEFYNRLKRLF